MKRNFAPLAAGYFFLLFTSVRCEGATSAVSYPPYLPAPFSCGIWQKLCPGHGKCRNSTHVKAVFYCFTEWAEVKAVATKASMHFIDKASLPKDVAIYTDEDEWSTWTKIGDNVLHIELRRWIVIAPLSANILGKIAGGLCDNFLTCIVRAWDYSKPLFVAPAMNTFMWNNPFIELHLILIDDIGINHIPPLTKRLACGDYGNGAMAKASLIFSTVRLFLDSHGQSSNGNTL